MIVGLPKEIKTQEYRVAMTPQGCAELIALGHEVCVQKDAGLGSGFSNEDYIQSGVKLLDSVAKLFQTADLIIKVKEPLACEYQLFKEHQILFTYLHLAADKEQTLFLLEKKIQAFSYETLEIEGRLPLLEPMSEVAGKMASMMGALYLSRYAGGKGLLMGGVTATPPAHVMILGAGVAGKAAAEMAAGLGARVTLLDINTKRLHYLKDVLPANVTTLFSNQENIKNLIKEADVIIGTVLIPGAKAPKLITKEMIKEIPDGSVLVDVSIDQGGCFQSSKATTHDNPVFTKEGVVHYCVANMPGAYPRTSTFALTQSTLPYIKQLASYGVLEVCKHYPEMISSLNTYEGILYNEGVGLAHDIAFQSFSLK